MDAKTEADRFIGIDVSKARVDVHVRPDGTAFYCTTDPDGLAELVGRLMPLRPRLVVLEASGGYEGVVAAALTEAGCRLRSSTRARCASSPAPLVGWPRPMPSMPQ